MKKFQITSIAFLITIVMTATSVKPANGYWTGNHAGNLLAWTFYLENGKSFLNLKYMEKNVRAIRSFLKNELVEITPVEGSVLLQNNGELKNCMVDGASFTYHELGDVSTRFEVFPNPVQKNIVVY